MSRSFKVDNWGSLLLQRIQQLYEKGEHCDMLLKFTTGEELPIHRLILHSCCNFFAILEGTEALENSTLHLPPELTREALDPVIRFMYTGQLDISEGSLSSLSSTAQLLDMPLLEQLLQTHALSNSDASQTPVKTPTRSLYRPKSGTPYNPPSKPATPKSGVKPALLPPAPSRLDLSVGDASCEYGSLPKMTQLLTEPVVTTPVPNTLVPLIRNKVKSLPVNRTPKRERTELKFDELRKTAPNPAMLPKAAEPEEDESPEAKKLRTEDIEGFKELLAEQRRRSELAAEEGGEDAAAYDTGVDVGLVDWDEEDDEEEEEVGDANDENTEQQQNSQQHKSILKTPEASSNSEISKRVHFSEEPEKVSESIEPEMDQQQHESSILTSSELSNTGGTPSKDSSTITIFDEGGHVLLREVIHSNMVTSQVQARMISEVLKRSPSLVTSGNNTKLKIVQRSPWYSKAKVSYVLLKPAEEEAAPTPTKPVRQSSTGTTPVRKNSNSNHSGTGSAIPVNRRSSPFDNTTGPWLCYDCVSSSSDIAEPEALLLKTYYEYRTHLVDIHGMKPDSQACEYCGHRALKRNHMLYHLYTIHGVPPPAHMKFPQCSECDYVALTSAIMRKHMQKHQEGVGHQCRVCNEPFTSLQGLLQHLHFTGHQRGHSRGHTCPVPGCGREYSRGMLLQAHVRTEHKEVAAQFDREGWPEKFDGSLLTASDSVADENNSEILQETEVYLEQPVVPSGETGDMAWVATNSEEVVELAEGESYPTEATLVAVADTDAAQVTETEALTNMANSIASSLGIAVTTTTVTTTEDGYTVAYLTTAEDGTQYITSDVLEAEGEGVAAPQLITEEGDCSEIIAIQEDQNMEQQ